MSVGIDTNFVFRGKPRPVNRKPIVRQTVEIDEEKVCKKIPEIINEEEKNLFEFSDKREKTINIPIKIKKRNRIRQINTKINLPASRKASLKSSIKGRNDSKKLDLKFTIGDKKWV